MGIVHILPEDVVNRIAAGEVIERPSSIVKELIENSLDAGAKSVEIEIGHGGRSLIRVSDDGSGMSADDAERAFQRYATSKITASTDLMHIASFGFRGEALPSIAAVSRVRMLTRPAHKNTGTEIAIEGGKFTGVKEAPCRVGTIMEVRDLFFNTPARRKFLKSEGTEMGHMMDVISHIALSRLDVQFTFTSGGKNPLELLPAVDLKSRAESVLGEDVGRNLLILGGEKGGVKVSGVIAKPLAARANRQGQIFFVNNRLVKAFSLSHGLQAGYHGLLMQGQYPVAVLFIDVDPERVDVNVHPTKQEVRISNETAIKNLIKELVAETLAKDPDLAPEFHIRRQDVAVFGERPFTQNRLDLESEKFQLNSTPSSVKEDWQPAYIAGPRDEASGVEPIPVVQASSEPPIHSGALGRKLNITKILGQIHHTFIIAETEDGLLILDQHAAHERVQFEAMLKAFQTSAPAKQKLLMETNLELSPEQSEILKESLESLSRMGFEIEEFGENVFVIRSVPAILKEDNPDTLIRHYLEEKQDGKIATGLDQYGEDVAAMIACKRKSVKAHDALRPEQLQALFDQLNQCENPFCCPHGRPTFLKQSFYELEKQFRRKV